MSMPKQPVSVTLDVDNLLWLRGRAASRKRKSLSDALDEILATARLRGVAADAPGSVVGTIALRPDDPGLGRADTSLQSLFSESLRRPLLVKEPRAAYRSTASKPARKTRARS